MAHIQNEEQYRAIMQRIDELMDIVTDDTPDYNPSYVELDLLSELVADYEQEHYPIEKPTLIDVLKLRMFEMKLSQCALADLLGMNQSKISEIISGKCEPTLQQARKISQVLNISPGIILG